MGEQSEVVLGDIPVVAKLALGSERLRLLVTNHRIIVAHIGKRGAGALAGNSFFGRLSGAIEDLFKSPGESRERKKLARTGPSEVLAADKDNFAIGYNEVISVEVSETDYSTQITLLTGQNKFEFSTMMPSDDLIELLSEKLGGKLKAKKISR